MLHKSCVAKRDRPPAMFPTLPPTGVFGDCGRHASTPVPAHLKSKLAIHDIVLVLEFASNVLSMQTKAYKSNQVPEAADGGAQVVSVHLLSCGSVISVPGHCVLRLDGHYSLTSACMTSHAHAEWSIRQTMTNDALTTAEKTECIMAFQDLPNNSRRNRANADTTRGNCRRSHFTNLTRAV
ncbi:hypothetical protein H257_12062 [Aphanomyces astaci]|uniref:Uncharacterized protein n=1 Tax=Aphanomyces astaci TaxID=112090 RepID=W4G1U6_APHAT|nr:hypothetical protein H257_12062 [Aphanomyces astaci]ETV73024.1 hypothetical protein H257_12062 [Aphanomyces astaci]|eukprot:XP_009837473.1 hypothetical protein H257_12062 [Aphanomyces astaci]